LEIIFGSIFNIYYSTPILCCTTGVSPGVQVVQAHPKSFDLVKIRGNLGNISNRQWTSEHHQ